MQLVWKRSFSLEALPLSLSFSLVTAPLTPAAAIIPQN